MEKYNGWKNYETWLFAIHYGDYLQEEYLDLKESNPDLNAVEFLNDFIEELIPSEAPGFLSDIIRTALESLDVERLAEVLLED